MIFEWDTAKDTVNRRKHGVSIDQAKRAFEDPSRVILEDPTHSAVENRYACLGAVEDRVLTVIFTHRQHSIRIITCGYWRKGRAIYEQENG
jgi:uncharacterized DUF497 family protein